MTARGPDDGAGRDPAEVGALRAYARLYRTLGRHGVQVNFQYRAANYMSMIGMVVEPVVYLVVWSTIAEQSGGSVGGYTPQTFAAYYIVWTLVRNMNIAFTPAGWEERIREGTMSFHLVRPMHPVHYDIGYFAGWKVVVIVLWIPIAVVLSLIFHPRAAARASSSASCSSSPSGARSCCARCCCGRSAWSRSGRRGRRRCSRCTSTPSCSCPAACVPVSLLPQWAQTHRRLPPVPLGLRLPDHRARRTDQPRPAVPRPARPARCGSRSPRSLVAVIWKRAVKHFTAVSG